MCRVKPSYDPNGPHLSTLRPVVLPLDHGRRFLRIGAISDLDAPLHR